VFIFSPISPMARFPFLIPSKKILRKDNFVAFPLEARRPVRIWLVPLLFFFLFSDFLYLFTQSIPPDPSSFFFVAPPIERSIQHDHGSFLRVASETLVSSFFCPSLFPFSSFFEHLNRVFCSSLLASRKDSTAFSLSLFLPPEEARLKVPFLYPSFIAIRCRPLVCYFPLWCCRLPTSQNVSSLPIWSFLLPSPLGQRTFNPHSLLQNYLSSMQE